MTLFYSHPARHQISGRKCTDLSELFAFKRQSRDTSKHHYVLSAAYNALENMNENNSLIFCEKNHMEIRFFAIIRKADTYYIITPFNRYFSTGSVDEAVEILRLIVTTSNLVFDRFVVGTNIVNYSLKYGLIGVS